MKRLTALLLVSTLAVGLLTGCGNNSAKNGNDLAGEETVVEEMEAGALNPEAQDGEGNVGKGEGEAFTVGFDAEFPPYGFMNDNGEYVGFDLSLFGMVLQLMDVKSLTHGVFHM